MCKFLIFNTPKTYEKQKNFGNFLKKIATFWQLLDTFIGNFFGIHRQLVAKPKGFLLEPFVSYLESLGL